MIVSVLMRKTRIKDRGEWEKRLSGVLPRVTDILKGEQGFAAVEYSWGVEGDGEMMQVTSWDTSEDCQRHVREGGAADIATWPSLVPFGATPIMTNSSRPNGGVVRLISSPSSITNPNQIGS